jgi:protein HOOK3
MSKRRLERQLKTLQEENAAGRNQKAVVLQHLLDDANRLKTQFEKNYIEVSQERDILQSDMARIREGIPDALVSQNEHTLSLRLRNLEIEKELKALRELTAKLEKKIALGQFAEEGEDAKSRFEQLEGKSKHLENQAQQHLESINKLLLEKDLLQRQSIEQKDMLLENEKMNSDMKASLAAFEAKDEETIKQHSIQLQHQIFQLQERLTSSKLKYKKAQEVSFLFCFVFASHSLDKFFFYYLVY